MDKIANFIVEHRKKIGVAFIIIIAISLLLIPQVKINYDLSEYIPNNTQSKVALDMVKNEFGMQSIARVMINNVTLPQAKEYKLQIEKIDGVDMVLWLDDSYDIYQPESFIDKQEIEKYYKDNSAIFEVSFSEDDYSLLTKQAINEIKQLVPDDANMMGSGIDMKSAQDNIQKEMISIMGILIPLVAIILLVTTTSWISPILFIAVIMVSIILNMGTNVIFPSVSFITYSIAAALQFAVTMDYAVFMLHQFEEEKKNTNNVQEAMKRALVNATLTIMSSSTTTIAGFLALTGMSFAIGKDIGLVFAKGIVLSLICIVFLMPYLIIKFNKLIEKTSHKPFVPSFERFSKVTDKCKWVIIVLSVIIIIPSYIAQKENIFEYGVSSFGGGEGTVAYEDEKKIVEKFGRSNPIVLLIPNQNYLSEKEMIAEIEKLDTIKQVQSLANTVSEGIPYSFIDKTLYNKFQNENYTRVIIYSKTSSESDLATKTVENIKGIVKKYYGDNYYLTGNILITLDMKNVIESDYSTVNMISILAIVLILLLTFKNIFLPILLILVIEAGIYINMAIPYFTGLPLIFMGYLIVSSIQLGVTIDYAILTTNNYIMARKTMNKKQAKMEAIKKSLPAILSSGGIMVCAGYLISFLSSMSAVSDMGALIGRGAFISVVLVIVLLPQLLDVFDKAISTHIIPRKYRLKYRKKKIERKIRFKKTETYKKQVEKLNNLIEKQNERRKRKNNKKIEKIQKKIYKLEKNKKELEEEK